MVPMRVEQTWWEGAGGRAHMQEEETFRMRAS